LTGPPRVAFVNGGILGLSSYVAWLRAALAGRRDIVPEYIVLTEDLSIAERLRRRVLCQRFWPDPPRLHNLDLARYRRETHAGMLARDRLRKCHGRFDVLHFHRQATAYGSLDLMRHTPAIISIDCTQSCVLQDMRGPLERWSVAPNVRSDGAVFSRAAAIVSTSHWAEHELRRMYPGCGTPIHVLPNPVSFEYFHRQWIVERAVRAAAGGLPRFLFVGGDFVRKGGYDLLDAWRAGGFAGRAELVLVTDWRVGPLPPGVSQSRSIQGHTYPWAQAWRQADVFVMPTRNEAFGLVFQEAAAAGLPIVGTRINAIPEIVEDGVSGLLVPPRDRAALVAVMMRLLESSEARERMGRAARARIERDADPDHHRDRLLDLIYEVAGRERG
jgi:glycosyltransferase involved in cell wall biosynthesis